MNKDFYTVRDIAEELQVTEKAVRYQIKEGKLEASKVLGKFVVTAENYKKYIDENTITAAEEENGL